MSDVYWQGPTGRTLTLKRSATPEGTATSGSLTETSRAGLYKATISGAAAGDTATVLNGSSPYDDGVIEADAGGNLWVVKRSKIASSESGSGARTCTLTVNDGTTVLQNAKVRVTQGSESYVQSTNASGVVVFYLDDATWSVTITKPGYSFAGASLVVNGTEAQTYSMTSVVVTPGDPDTTTAYITIRDGADDPVSGATVQIQVLKFANNTTGTGIDNPLVTGTTDVSGYVEFPGLPRLARYQVRVGDGEWFKGTTLDADTTPLAAVLGVAE